MPRFTLPDHLPLAGATVPGWISTLRYVSHFNFVTQDGPPMTELCHDLGPGVLVTGTTDWADYTFAADLCLHMADAAGLIVRYQGLRRYLALVQRGGKLQLVRQYHGETVLAEIPHTWATDAFHRLAVTCHGAHITATLDGAPLFSVKEPALPHGGAGFLCDMGKIGFRAAAVTDG